MRRTLTARLVETVQTRPTGRVEITDTITPGLALRVGPRTKTWLAIYRSPTGVVRRQKLGDASTMSLAAARRIAQALLAAAKDGRDPAAEKQDEEACTFENLASDYMTRHAKPRKKSWRNDERILNRHLLPHFAARPLSKITRREVRDRLDEIAAAAPIQANRVRALLSKLFSFAVARDWLSASPMVGLQAPSQERSRTRSLSGAEVRQFWRALATQEKERALESSQADQLRLRLLMGQRASEIATMRWDDIDQVGGVWTQPSPKNGRMHVLPISKEFASILARRKAAVPALCPWVFPNATLDGPDVHRAWRGVQQVGTDGVRIRSTGLTALGIVDARGHDLRRTCATHMARLGVPPHLIGRLLNHAEALGHITQIYNRHTYLPELRHALELWADEVERLASGDDTAMV